MITERTLLRTIRETVFLGNVPPIIIPLGVDDGNHLTSFQSHLHYVFVRKCHGRKHRALIGHKDVHN
jgi:hypothetical protein